MTTPEQAERPLSPEDDLMTAAEEAQQERREDARVAARLCDISWWEMTGIGINDTSELTDKTLAAIMPYVEPAYREMANVNITQVGSTLVVLHALRKLLAAATARARKEVGDE